MSYYTTPTGNETNGLYELFKFTSNNATNGLFWPIMLLVIWVVSFLAFKNYSTSRAWTFASFFCSILGIFLAVMDYISPKWMYLTIVMTVVGFVWLKLETR
jgi:hypothetical protein